MTRGTHEADSGVQSAIDRARKVQLSKHPKKCTCSEQLRPSTHNSEYLSAFEHSQKSFFGISDCTPAGCDDDHSWGQWIRTRESSMNKRVVDCRHNGVLLRTYEIPIFETRIPRPEPNQHELEAECRQMLARDRLAFPPYSGITFTHR